MFGRTFKTAETLKVMPAIHQARRTRANRKTGNPFANAAQVEASIAELANLYASVSAAWLLQKIKVEIDALEMELA